MVATLKFGGNWKPSIHVKDNTIVADTLLVDVAGKSLVCKDNVGFFHRQLRSRRYMVVSLKEVIFHGILILYSS